MLNGQQLQHTVKLARNLTWVIRVKTASSSYDPVTSFTRLKKARLRSVLMPQFTGTV
jgi:hypothetical protein